MRSLNALKQKVDKLHVQTDGNCHCNCVRWIRDSLSPEPPPATCWKCGGSDPRGFTYQLVEVSWDAGGNVTETPVTPEG